MKTEIQKSRNPEILFPFFPICLLVYFSIPLSSFLFRRPPAGRGIQSAAAPPRCRGMSGTVPAGGSTEEEARDGLGGGARDASIDLETLHCDGDIVVIVKPAGLMAVPSGLSSPGQGRPAAGKKRRLNETWSRCLRGCEAWDCADPSVAAVLPRIAEQSHSVPRKRRRFDTYARKALRMDPADGAKLFAFLTARFHGEHGRPCDSALTRVRARFPEARCVHRLDEETSGVMVFALTLRAAQCLGEQFRNREVAKTYEAVVAGAAPSGADCGTWDGPILADRDAPSGGDRDERARSIRQVVHPEGKASRTVYEVAAPGRPSRIDRLYRSEKAAVAATARSGNVPAAGLVAARPPEGWAPLPSGSGGEGPPARTRLRLMPITGRTHQLRVHCAHAGCPILGDSLYFPEGASGGAYASDRLLLHAGRLRFRHPGSSETVTFEAPAPF